MSIICLVGDEVKSLVTFTPNWRTVMSMDSVTLICNVGSAEQEKETFYWYRDDRLIYNYQQNFTIQSANWRYDRGYYQCRTSTSDISEPVTLNIKNSKLYSSCICWHFIYHQSNPLTAFNSLPVFKNFKN